MNIFKNSSWTWWQMGLLKLSLFVVGIAVGSYWSAFFMPYAAILAIVGIVVGLWLATIWYKQ
jgi:uncharacterized membrane protein YgaE (UPF0421/DUF939 family)